jgi:hypothetical protein
MMVNKDCWTKLKLTHEVITLWNEQEVIIIDGIEIYPIPSEKTFN